MHCVHELAQSRFVERYDRWCAHVLKVCAQLSAKTGERYEAQVDATYMPHMPHRYMPRRYMPRRHMPRRWYACARAFLDAQVHSVEV
jgi:hypothetical protein